MGGPPCDGCQADKNPFSIYDRVKVPNLPDGDYTLSWRWDCDVTKQVWLNCGDITIKGSSPVPTPMPAPTPTPSPGATYKCFDDGCRQASGGVPKTTCEQVCERKTYKCFDNGCQEASGGVSKASCDQ